MGGVEIRPVEIIAPKPGVPLVRALDRGVALLKAFTAEKPRRTLTELAVATSLDKGTARRLLHTLALCGLVAHDERTGLYALTIGVLELGAAVETGRDLHEVAAPYLAEIAAKTRATAFLWVHHEGSALCVGRVRAPGPSVEVAWSTIGTRIPLNCGAGPRTLLAFLPAEEREAALSRPLTARTPASQTEPDQLRSETARIRVQGWEFAVDDFVVGLCALGAPIFEPSGTLAGSLSITTLTGQIAADSCGDQLGPILRAAAEIGANLA
ncbi:IclR family transcriptional regulator [Methylobacterium planeticum]|uniref:IclR family transcriptional regulator n=1 Tax=Methylobacterium planeticum TaxID=2615211 RepID=A0A6N6MLU4_9HYPH|nr:IclR family transcriptional regulator [Methylobacterium planeticum]KAB1072268.1 IclR family transcriptional regulator [Methylobacterium planeticum]